MTERELRDTILRLLSRVAPETDASAIGPDEPLQQALDIDSFDFLNFLVSVRDELHVTIDESDYGKMRTIAEMVRFLLPRVASKS
jgi:acyl carrier protein